MDFAEVGFAGGMWIAFGFVAAFISLMAPEGRVMKRNGAGIVDFELAKSRSRAQAILDGWGDTGRAAAARQVVLDYPFVLAYVAFLGGWMLWLGEQAVAQGWLGLDFEGIGLVAAGAVTLAGGLDWIENTMLLRQFGRTGPTDLNVAITYQAARAKFFVLLVALPAAALGTPFAWLLGGT